MKKILIVALAIMISNVTFASNERISILDNKFSAIHDFKKYYTGNNDLVWYYSPESIKKYINEDSPNKVLWDVTIKLKHKDGHLIEHERVDCKENFLNHISRLHYKKDGTPEIISKQRLIYAGSSGTYMTSQGLIELKKIVCK